MTDDIVTRLRIIHCAADDLTPCGTCLTCQAADEIERLRMLTKGNTTQMSSNADDIVTRLREFAGEWDHVGLVPGDDLREAADEIERSRAELEQSRQDHLATFLELMAVRCG
jgi:hypothetical protein